MAKGSQFKNKFTSKYFTTNGIIISLLLLFIIFEVVIYLKPTNFLASYLENRAAASLPHSDENFKKFANTVVNKCKDQKYPPDCYDKEIPKYMDPPISLTMEEAFKLTKFVQDLDDRYLYCHVLAHNVSAKEAKKDLTKWKDVIARCPNTVCNNGCSHGALMERYKGEALTEEQLNEAKNELRDVCEPRGDWKPRNIEISMCYHAIGHLNMYMTNANINKSIELCDYIGKPRKGVSQVQTCVEGVFMSIFQPLEPEDEALIKDIKPKRSEITAFCGKYSGVPFHACHRESWPLFVDWIDSPSGLVKFCTYSDDPEGQDQCFGSLMNQVAVKYIVKNNNDISKIIPYCTKLPDKRIGPCFAHTARRLMQLDPAAYLDKSIEVCKIADSLHKGEDCYKLISYNIAKISFATGSTEAKNSCDKLPETWKDKCLSLK